jgi:transcriptional regulator with XRE-family HTH domain
MTMTIKEIAHRFGDALRAARERMNIDITEAAIRLHVSEEFYERMERGASLPGYTLACRAVERLRLRPAEALCTTARDMDTEAELAHREERLRVTAVVRDDVRAELARVTNRLETIAFVEDGTILGDDIERLIASLIATARKVLRNER